MVPTSAMLKSQLFRPGPALVTVTFGDNILEPFGAYEMQIATVRSEPVRRQDSFRSG